MIFEIKKITYSSVILLLILSLIGCKSNSVETNVAIQEDKDVKEGIVTKRISGETSKENLLKIKEYLFSEGELNNFKAKIVNISEDTVVYKIGDELKYNKQNQFDSAWYIHYDKVLYVCIY